MGMKSAKVVYEVVYLEPQIAIAIFDTYQTQLLYTRIGIVVYMKPCRKMTRFYIVGGICKVVAGIELVSTKQSPPELEGLKPSQLKRTMKPLWLGEREGLRR